MILPKTLSAYMVRRFLFNLASLLLVLAGIIYLFDTIELIRRASKREDIELALIFLMGLLKLPEAGLVIFPFAVLFSAMYTFWQLNRSYELVVIRAAGLSVWQFLAPVAAAAFLVGLFLVTVFNPAGSLFLAKFEELEQKHLERQAKLITFFQEGLWLRQSVENGYVIMHAERIKMPDWKLEDTMVLHFDEQNNFLRRIDAKDAALMQGRWHFSEAWLSEPREETEEIRVYSLPTALTLKDIEESFSSPETISFWQLPEFISVLEATGFDTTNMRIYYQSLLAQPLFFTAMVLLAACVSLRPPRLRAGIIMILSGIFLGFLTFFVSSYLQALGASGQIPVLLAAWSAPVMAFLMALTIILQLEDG